MKWISPLLLVVAALAPAPACDNPVDTSENVLPYRSDAPDTAAADEVDAAGGDVSAGACDCLAVGQWFRLDTLALETFDGSSDHTVIPVLNDLWRNDIDNDLLNILFEIRAVSDTELTVRSFSAAHRDTGGGICLLPYTEQEIVFPRRGCELDLSNAVDFVIYAGSEAHPKNCSTTLPVPHVIPIDGARLAGRIADGCDTIGGGTVPEGSLGDDELGQLCTCVLASGSEVEQCGALDPDFAGDCPGCNANYSSLRALLVAFGEPQWTCQTKSGGRSACITARWSAVSLDQTPPDCGP